MQYATKVKLLTKKLKTFKLYHILQSKNKRADVLSKLASSEFPNLAKQVLVEKAKKINK